MSPFFMEKKQHRVHTEKNTLSSPCTDASSKVVCWTFSYNVFILMACFHRILFLLRQSNSRCVYTAIKETLDQFLVALRATVYTWWWDRSGGMCALCERTNQPTNQPVNQPTVERTNVWINVGCRCFCISHRQSERYGFWIVPGRVCGVRFAMIHVLWLYNAATYNVMCFVCAPMKIIMTIYEYE